MITITRQLAQQVKGVLRHLLAGTSRYLQPPVLLETGPQGLSISCCDAQRGFTYHDSVPQPECSIRAPVELFKEVAGARPVPVTLTTSGNSVIARWQDGAIPQSKEFPGPNPDRQPIRLIPPATFAENPPAVLARLHDAMQTADKDSARYAIQNVQIRGKERTIVATDGKQLLLQSGLALGWKETILVPATSLFGGKELPKDQPVFIGKTDGSLAVRVGPWTVYLAIDKEGRYPEVDSLVLPRQEAKSTLEMHASDAQFLLASLPQLPTANEEFQPVTVDLDNRVAVRGKAATDDAPTELLLRNSEHAGEALRVSVDRRLLGRTMRLGFKQVAFFGTNKPIQCYGDKRVYLWMPLEPEAAIPASKEAVVIESPVAGATTSPPPPVSIPISQTKASPMTTTSTSQAAPAAASGSPSPAPKRRRTTSSQNGAANPGPIEQAAALRDAARELLAKTSQLVKSLKRQRKQQRLMATTLASLKDLQAA